MQIPLGIRALTTARVTMTPLSLYASTQSLSRTPISSPSLSFSQNGSTPLNIAVAYINAKNEFMESKQLKVPANSWSTLSVKLEDKQFKSQANGWKYADVLDGKENVQRIIFLIYERRPVTLWIDGIFFK